MGPTAPSGASSTRSMVITVSSLTAPGGTSIVKPSSAVKVPALRIDGELLPGPRLRAGPRRGAAARIAAARVAAARIAAARIAAARGP